MGSTTRLTFVLSDVVPAAQFEATCAGAGFNGSQARRFAAVYAGPSSAERRLARAIGERLWLPAISDPCLASALLGLDEAVASCDAVSGAAGGHLDHAVEHAMTQTRVGSALLELAMRHRASQIVLVLCQASFVQASAHLHASIRHRVQMHERGHGAVFEFELRALETLADGAAFASLEASPCAPAHARLRRWLQDRGVDHIAHPGGTLLDHLQGTALLLRCWRARPALIVAGLGHAIYGTHGFSHRLMPIDARLELAQMIGAESEAIIYAHASCDRAAGHPTTERPSLRDRFSGLHVPIVDGMIADLAMLTCANELDIALHAQHASGAVLHHCAALGDAAQRCSDQALDLLSSPIYAKLRAGSTQS